MVVLGELRLNKVQSIERVGGFCSAEVKFVLDYTGAVVGLVRDYGLFVRESEFP